MRGIDEDRIADAERGRSTEARQENARDCSVAGTGNGPETHAT